MKYEKPKVVAYGEGNIAEWAVTLEGSLPQHSPAVACGRSNPVDCHCTMGGSKAFSLATCHCANSGSRVSYKTQESTLKRKAA